MHPRLGKVEAGFSQDWEIFRIVTSDVKGMPTYTELDTVCNVDDIYNCLEILDAKFEMDEVARIEEKNKQT